MASHYEIRDLVSDETCKTLTLKVFAEDETLAELLIHQMENNSACLRAGYSRPHSFENSVVFKIVTPLDTDPCEVFRDAFRGVLNLLNEARRQVEEKMPDDDFLIDA